MERSWSEREGGHEDQEADEQWVYDSSVDHQGKVPRRATTGTWKAALFIIAIEFSERLSYFGLSTNLIIYLTTVLHQDPKTAAKNVNYWSGVTTTMPLVGGFLADAYLGRFSTVLLSSTIYIGGLVLLILSQLIPSLKPCNTSGCHESPTKHEVVFFIAMYLVSIGTGGHKPSLESFGADQFDDGNMEERKQKMSFFNWWNFGLCSGLLIGVTVIVYVQDNISWWIADVILTAVMIISIAIFIAGRAFYRYRVPQASPFTHMLQVLVAAAVKRHLPLPSDVSELHECPESLKADKRLPRRSGHLRFLDRAAIVEQKTDLASIGAQKQSPWRLATVTQVEEVKQLLSMVPIWLACLPFGICAAQASTFFIKQASIMDRTLSGSFQVPPASVYSLAAIGMIVSVCLYDLILVPFFRRLTGNERGISILQRIGIGMVFVSIGMATAAVVETKRLGDAANGKKNVNVLWLVPQFMILGFGDGFTLVGLQEYFYDQVPDSMRSLGIAFYLSVIGAANFLSSLLITLVDHLTGRVGEGSWFAKDLNKSKLDNFYWLLAAMGALNVLVYVVLAKRHSYKNKQTKVSIANSSDGDDDGVPSVMVNNYFLSC